jgi:hypothetical protein
MTGPRSRSNALLKVWNCRESSPRPLDMNNIHKMMMMMIKSVEYLRFLVILPDVLRSILEGVVFGYLLHG